MNDLGSDTQGGGKSSALADEVVATIRANGGTAVPNYGVFLCSSFGVFLCSSFTHDTFEL